MARNRLAQCDETCTVDCGACKGDGPPPRDHRSAEAQAFSRALAKQHEQMSADIHEWAKGDDELGWPGDDILKDRGNCDDLAAFLQERGWNRVVGP